MPTSTTTRWSVADVADANRRYYARTASDYEHHETCLIEPAAQEQLRRDLAEIARSLPTGGAPPRALDACGGTGNATLKLLELGFEVVNVDVSPSMHALLREKLRARGQEERCTIVEGEVGDFLAHGSERFDLIVFSSALHHLLDYTGVLLACRERLAPHGLLYTTFDPTAREHLPRPARAALALDYLLYKIVVRFDDLPASAGRWLARRLGRDPAPQTLAASALGTVAEFHARSGIDDRALAAALEAKGLRIQRHRRSAHARLAPIERWLRRRGHATEFDLLARRDDAPPFEG